LFFYRNLIVFFFSPFDDLSLEYIDVKPVQTIYSPKLEKDLVDLDQLQMNSKAKSLANVYKIRENHNVTRDNIKNIFLQLLNEMCS
jgi:hypothetical protein